MHEDGKVASEKTSLKDAANIEDGEEVAEENKLTFRQKLAAFLQSNAVQYTVIAFVVIDGIIVLLELIIDFGIIKFPDEGGHDALNSTHHSNDSAGHHPTFDETTHEPLMVVPDPHHNNGEHHHVKHHGRHHKHHDYSLVSQTITTVANFLLNSTSDEYNGNYSLHGDGHHDDHHGDHHGAHHHSTKEKVEHALHFASLIILTLFLIEVICKVYAEGKHLLKHKAEVLDAFVVVISFSLDVVFSFIDVAQATKDAAGLMVMLRLWRVTRLINGVIISVQMEADKKVHKIEVVLHEKERENEQLQDKLKLLQEELEMLKNKMKNGDSKSSYSVSKSMSQSPLQTLSQKTDADITDVLMGWDSPQFLNSHSGQVSISSTSASSTTTSTVSSAVSSAVSPPAAVKDLKSSSTSQSQSSKSMFMVFEEQKDKSSAGGGPNPNLIGPKPPVFVVPVDEGSPKHTATNAGYEDENHPHQILHFPQPPPRRSSKDENPTLSSIQPYISPNYPVSESATKKKALISPTQPNPPPKHVTGDQPITNGPQKHSIASQYSPPPSLVEAPRKLSASSPADQKKESDGKAGDYLQPVIPHKHLALSDPQLTIPAPIQPEVNTPPTSGSDQVFPIIPPPASKRSSENRKKSVPGNYSSGAQPLKLPPKPENTMKSPVETSTPDNKVAEIMTAGPSLEHDVVPLQPEHPAPPAAIILPPVSSVPPRKNSPNGQNSEYMALISPRQPSPLVSENVFFEIDDTSPNSSFLGDAMSDAPAEKDPGAPR